MNPAFRKSEWKRLEAYMMLLRDEMRLHHWTIFLRDETPEEAEDGNRNALAYVEPDKNHYSVNVFLAADFPSQPPEKQREALVHELVHVHLRDVSTILDELSEPFGVLLFNIIVGYYHQRIELFVQEMALLIAPRFPLPEIRRRKR
jgi:hypothetical protein